jgi:hypothetical protein
MARFTTAGGEGSGAPGPQGPQGPAGEDAVLPQDLGTTDSPTFSKITLTSNGATDNITIGDDVILGDGNVANHVVIIGQQDATQGGIVLGDNETERVSSYGSNLSLTANNDIILNPASTYAYIGTPQLDGSNRIAKMSDITGGTGPAGEDGADALWNYTGEYNAGASYAVGDLATYDGQLWYRANANGGNVGDTPSEGFIWNLLAAKGAHGADGADGSGGLVYLGNYISGNGYVTDLAVVRGSDNNLYIAKASGGLADPVGNTAEWDIFSTNTGGSIADLGDFQFTAGTATVNDNETLIIQANNSTTVKSQLVLNPYGVAKLEAFDNPNTTTFSAANPDWDSATWSVEPGIGSVIQFVNAPNIINWVNSLTTSVYDASLIINGVAAGTVNGLSYGSTDVTLYINNTVPTEDPTVNELGFLFVASSFIDINYDNGSFDLEATNMDINIRSDDDVYITASGDDILLRASDDIRFTSNYNDPSGETYGWTMDSEGEFHLPGQGLIWNPSGTSGDGYGNDTLHLVPNDTDNETEQRIIIDPTAPNHIHIRAGGVQDYSNVELILGGERAGVRVSDATGTTVVQSKQEDYSWSYQNVNSEGGQIYVVATADAEPDYNDFTIISGQKYVITNVVRDVPNGTTSYETTPSIGFIAFENYTFIRDRGNHVWNFNRQGYLSGPTETGSLRVTGIINDDGDVSVVSDTDNVSITSGQDTNINANDAVRITTFGGDYGWDFGADGKFYGPGEEGTLILGGELVTQDANMSIRSNGQSVILNGTLGEFLGSSDAVNNQIATIGDVTTAVGVGGNGEVTRWSPNFQATGLTFTGTDTTYPTYNSHYVKNGRMVSFWIAIDLATVTNFGTGQYITALPYAPLTGTMNHFQAWANVDPAVNPDIAGHVVLQADHLANTTALDLHYLKQAGGANSPLMEAMFTQDAPATLTTSSKIYINGTYITAE